MSQKLIRTTLVFVYGTLKHAEPNAAVMENPATGKCKLVGSGKTVNAYPLIIASKYNIPFCLDQPGTGFRVSGELYEVDEQKLKTLDEFENHPSFYMRKSIKVEMDHKGDIVTAWSYLLPKWGPDLLNTSTDYLETYNSNGPHNRPYVISEESRSLDDL